MAVTSTVYTAVATTASTLIAPYSAATQRTAIIRNDGAGTIYIGGSNVGSISTGYSLVPNATVTLVLNSEEALYGVVNTGTGTVTILQVHV